MRAPSGCNGLLHPHCIRPTSPGLDHNRSPAARLSLITSRHFLGPRFLWEVGCLSWPSWLAKAWFWFRMPGAEFWECVIKLHGQLQSQRSQQNHVWQLPNTPDMFGSFMFFTVWLWAGISSLHCKGGNLSIKAYSLINKLLTFAGFLGGFTQDPSFNL